MQSKRENENRRPKLYKGGKLQRGKNSLISFLSKIIIKRIIRKIIIYMVRGEFFAWMRKNQYMKTYLSYIKTSLAAKLSLVLTIVLIGLSVYDTWVIYRYVPSFAWGFAFAAVLVIALFFFVLQRYIPKLTCVLQALLCVLLAVGSTFLHTTDTTVTKITETKEYQTIQIVTWKERNIQKDADFKKMTMVYDKNDTESYTVAKELLTAHEIVLKNTAVLDTTQACYTQLEKGNADLMVLSSLGRAELEETVENLDDTVTVLFEKKVELGSVHPKEIDISKEPFTLYICGVDLSGINNVNATGRGDVNILLTINPQTKNVNLQVVPRDLFVYIPVKDASSKLSYSGWWGGVESSIASIEKALDVEINYYVKINFTGLIDLVDAVDGIDVYSHYTYTAGGFYFTEGYNHVNGEQALAMARERKTLPLNERSRGYQQMEIIKGIFTRFAENPTYDNGMAVLDSIADNFMTNLPEKDFYKAFQLVIDLLPQLQAMETHSMEGEYLWHYDEVRPSYYQYYFYPADGEIEAAKARIQAVLKGK